MNRKTIWEILDKVYEEEPLAILSVDNKKKDITISRHGWPEPVLGNMEEIYANNKNKVDKTVKEIVKLVREFEKSQK